MAPVVKLPVDGLAYRGFATILYDVLDSLGVPTEKIEYVCRGEPRPDGIKGHIVVHLKVPTSEFVPVLRAFETLENRCYQDLLFHCDEEFLKVERKEEEMVGKLKEERMGYDRMKTFYETHEKSLREEIANLKDKVGEAELRHDYLESKRLTLREFHEKEKHHGIKKLALEAHCNTMEKLAVEAAVTTTYNMHHLVHYIKCTEYLQDKVNRISQAWIDTDRKRV
ncbi:unnamed protein product [Miscanthus lutarioriparius]|uniref:Uncharacterized protein n=1 Tax=Miscanthus lutarioriparius TaxID=422564 RepID=A0A811P9Q9_9POAL|nr:unnamed protein product [Miscanthus lutarioriparius]